MYFLYIFFKYIIPDRIIMETSLGLHIAHLRQGRHIAKIFNCHFSVFEVVYYFEIPS